MVKYKVSDIATFFGFLYDEEIEADDEIDAIDCVFTDIMSNIGHYIEVEVEEVSDEEDEDEEESESDL